MSHMWVSIKGHSGAGQPIDHGCVPLFKNEQGWQFSDASDSVYSELLELYQDAKDFPEDDRLPAFVEFETEVIKTADTLYEGKPAAIVVCGSAHFSLQKVICDRFGNQLN